MLLGWKLAGCALSMHQICIANSFIISSVKALKVAECLQHLLLEVLAPTS